MSAARGAPIPQTGVAGFDRNPWQLSTGISGNLRPEYAPAAGDTTPGAIAPPRLPFEGLRAFALPRAQWASGEASALGGAPPARAEEGKAPQDGFVGREHHDRATARLVLEGGQCQSPRREVSGVRIQATGRALVASSFFLTRHARFRGRGGPRFHGLRQSPARDTSMGKSGSHAPGGRDRSDA